MKKIAKVAACTALCLSASSVWAAGGGGISGVRGIDHIGFTVPDINQGVAFFHDVMGCTEVMRFGPFSDDKGTFMQDLVNVDPRAVILQREVSVAGRMRAAIAGNLATHPHIAESVLDSALQRAGNLAHRVFGRVAA